MRLDSESSASSRSPSHDAMADDGPLRLLVEAGLQIASERSLHGLAQTTVNAGLQLCKAELGIIVYRHHADDGETYELCRYAGITAEQASYIAPLTTLENLIPSHFFSDDASRVRGLMHVPDLTAVTGGPSLVRFKGLPAFCSYLAAPIRHHGGELLGVLVYGHPHPHAFSSRSEEFVEMIAAQAATAIDNLRLSTNLGREIDIADSARTLQRETADQLRQALDAAHLGTWSWNRDTDRIELDDRSRQMFGVKPGIQVTRSALRRKIVSADESQSAFDRLTEALEFETNYAAEYRIDCGSGQAAWISASGMPTLATNPDGVCQVIGMVGTLQDITARKSQESILRESEKLAATGRMAATIAHEINNPLEAITNLIYLARTDEGVPEHVQHLLDTADGELARVSQIAQQTLGFYRDTSKPGEIDLNKLITATVDLFTRKMRSKNITCTIDLDPGLRVNGLQGELRQVFSNLIVNAIDASGPNSRVHLRGHRFRQNGIQYISVLVADNGTGIPLSVRPKLFTPFVTTKESKGTGLGLWVTRGIIEKQGGRISFRTRTPSPSGTVFRISLPACSNPLTP
jgi:signal transduction histidine kinase